MIKRIMTALVAVLVFIPLLWIGSWPLQVAVTLLAVLGFAEFLQMKELPIASFPAVISLIGVILIVLASGLLPFAPLTVFARVVVGVIVLLFLYSLRFTGIKTKDIGEIILLMVYIGTGFYTLAALREVNLSLLFLILLVIWTTDSGALIIGKKVGKHKLAPGISPNKTIEGSLGGTVLATLLSIVYLIYFPQFNSMVISVLLMILVSVVGQLGDLLESKIKREYDVKDSGNVLPGHGGILDRFDSLLIVLNVLFLIGLV